MSICEAGVSRPTLTHPCEGLPSASRFSQTVDRIAKADLVWILSATCVH